MFENLVIIDGRGHLLGRLASIVAKQLLSGQKIVIVRAEQMVMSGSLLRKKTQFALFLKKRMNTNPSRGPYHLRTPGQIFWRTVRGMLPHKTDRGQLALGRLKCYEGIPHPYDKKKRMVVPDALRVLRLKPHRRHTVLGRLAGEVGWERGEVVKRLEAKRKIKSRAFYLKKKATSTLKQKAANEADLSAVAPVLSQYGM